MEKLIPTCHPLLINSSMAFIPILNGVFFCVLTLRLALYWHIQQIKGWDGDKFNFALTPLKQEIDGMRGNSS